MPDYTKNQDGNVTEYQVDDYSQLPLSVQERMGYITPEERIAREMAAFPRAPRPTVQQELDAARIDVPEKVGGQPISSYLKRPDVQNALAQKLFGPVGGAVAFGIGDQLSGQNSLGIEQPVSQKELAMAAAKKMAAENQPVADMPVAQPAQAAPSGQKSAGPSAFESKIRKLNEDARLEGEKAALAEMNAAQAKAAGEAELLKQREDAMLDQEQRRMTAEMARQESLDNQMKEYRSTVDEIKKINTTVDPNRYWANAGTGQKILSAIGLIIGGAAAGRNGENVAATAIDKAIQQDIDAQKATITASLQKGEQLSGMQKNIYSMMLQKFGDERAAESASKLAMLEVFESKIAQNAAKSSGQAAQANYQKALAQLSAQKAQSETALMQYMDKRALDWSELALKGRELSMKGGAGLTTDQRKKLDEIEPRRQNIDRNIARLRSLVEEHGTVEKVEPGIENEMRGLANDIAVDLAKLKDPNSVARPGEVELELQTIFQPGAFQRKSAVFHGLDQLRERTNQRANDQYQLLGVQPPRQFSTKEDLGIKPK